MPYYVYIITNRKHGVLYTGMTNNLRERIFMHREGRGSGFAAKYGCARLVWFEEFAEVNDAIATEKRVKKWRRAWKVKLIEDVNPAWDDLYPAL